MRGRVCERCRDVERVTETMRVVTDDVASNHPCPVRVSHDELTEREEVCHCHRKEGDYSSCQTETVSHAFRLRH